MMFWKSTRSIDCKNCFKTFRWQHQWTNFHPKLYSGQDRNIFLFGFEAIRDTRPRFDAAATSWVPTAKLRTGDFSDYLPASGCTATSTAICICDPASRVASGTTFVGTHLPETSFQQIESARSHWLF